MEKTAAEHQNPTHSFVSLSFTECEFNIQIYDNNTTSSRDKTKVTPVMIYVIKDGKNHVAFCKDGYEVHPMEMVRTTPDVQCDCVIGFYYFT